MSEFAATFAWWIAAMAGCAALVIVGFVVPVLLADPVERRFGSGGAAVFVLGWIAVFVAAFAAAAQVWG